MSRHTFMLLLVAGFCALVASVSFLVGPLFEPSTRESQPTNESFGTGGWVVIAAIAGAVFTSLGAFLNDFYARQREDRLAEREAEEQRQQWDREDRIRKEEQIAAEQLRVRDDRAPAYKAFVAATTFPAPFSEEHQGALIQELNERYTDVLLYCSDWVEAEAGTLYDSALEALSEPEAEEHEASRQRLKEKRTQFWAAVREEARRDYSHS